MGEVDFLNIYCNSRQRIPMKTPTPLPNKRSKWNILCRLQGDGESDQDKKEIKLSFTTENFEHFVPPNGNVTDFNICTELIGNYPELKVGIYTDPLACCLVTNIPEGICLHGVSHDLQKLRDLIFKILSSAGMRPKVTHHQDTLSSQQLLLEWSEAILSTTKK